jgi:hypothetical protein
MGRLAYLLPVDVGLALHMILVLQVQPALKIS